MKDNYLAKQTLYIVSIT